MRQSIFSDNASAQVDAVLDAPPHFNSRIKLDNFYALVPPDEPMPSSVTRLEAWQGINRYRTSEPSAIKTAIIVHPEESIRKYINRSFVDLVENKLNGRTDRSVFSWDVAFYYAINSKGQLTFYVIPIFVDEYGDELDYYTEQYQDVDPVYYFKRGAGILADARDDDEIAFDFGHIKPVTLI